MLTTQLKIPAHQVPSEKGSTLKGKNLLPRGANSFLLGRALSEGMQNIGCQFDYSLVCFKGAEGRVNCENRALTQFYLGLHSLVRFICPTI